jgi:two-component system sensor histidine kinase KdpD
MRDKNETLTTKEPIQMYQKEARGHFKIFLGYAPGVGKTFGMLCEGNRRLKSGQDVAVGYIELHGRYETQKQIKDLEIIPRKTITYAKVIMEEMDTDEIISRKPDTVLIDDLAHTNAPGSKYKNRYEDIIEILDNGINVVCTLNIFHLESLNDMVKKITGIKVHETIPDHLVDNADEVIVVDLTPEELQSRLKCGNIYEKNKVPQLPENFFCKEYLTALRKITFMQIAGHVDDSLSEYMNENGFNENLRLEERVMVCIDESPTSKKLIRRGARIAKRFHCDWYAVSVNCTSIHSNKEYYSKNSQMLITHQKLALQLGAKIVILDSNSEYETLAKFANEHHITQILIGKSKKSWWEKLFRGSTISKLVDSTKNVDVCVVSAHY